MGRNIMSKDNDGKEYCDENNNRKEYYE